MDVHELDQLLLIGSGVLILAILAVRVSVTAGLPSLLVYLALGLLLGNSGLGIAFDDADLRTGARLRGARADPRRGWTVDEVGAHPPIDGLRAPAGDPRLGHQRDRGRGRRALPARPRLGAGVPARRGHDADRCGGGVLGAAHRAAEAPGHRDARGRVGPQRRPDRRAGRRDQRRRPRRDRAPGRSPGSDRLRADRRRDRRPGRSAGSAPVCCAGSRCRRRVSIRWWCSPSRCWPTARLR